MRVIAPGDTRRLVARVGWLVYKRREAVIIREKRLQEKRREEKRREEKRGYT